MKKLSYIFALLITTISLFVWSGISVSAREVIGSATLDNMTETLGSIYVNDDGKVVVEYKYGLKKITLYYCEKEQCVSGNYLMKEIMESSLDIPNKNDSEDMATYSFYIDPPKDKEYSVIVEGFFGANSSYKGSENANNWPIRKIQADTGENYLKVDSKSNGIRDKRLSKLMDDVVEIVNTMVIPVIYIITSLFLVIKGAILGFQIVKSADQPETRREKIHALKWLVIGVAITYAATSVVGLVSGFFKDAFDLHF